MISIFVDTQLHDLNTVIFALKSVPAPESVITELISELERVKICMTDLKTISLVYQNFFERNNTPKDMQNHLILSLAEKCLIPIKEKTSTLLQLLQPLNYPLPQMFLSKIDFKETDLIVDPGLIFELKLFQWLQSIVSSPMNDQLLTNLKNVEGFNELNLQIPDRFIGFLTYGTILDDWKVKDLRLNKSIDSILKEWNNRGILQAIRVQCKNEFLTLKNGLIIVSKM